VEPEAQELLAQQGQRALQGLKDSTAWRAGQEEPEHPASQAFQALAESQGSPVYRESLASLALQAHKALMDSKVTPAHPAEPEELVWSESQAEQVLQASLG
jgi:hypothetical protein